MLDFRYHALSLVAVFLALTVGLLLGVAIGDQGLVSSAGSDIRASLRSDVRKANDRAARLRGDLRERQRFAEDAYPLLVDNRLTGRRIGIVGLGGLPDTNIGLVREALKQTGGRLATVAVFREPVGLDSLTDPDVVAAGQPPRRRAKGKQPRAATPAPDPRDPSAIERFGRTLGIDLTQSGTLLKRKQRSLLASSSGSFSGLEGVVLVRAAPDLKPGDTRAAAAFEKGLIAGMTQNNVPVVGVETAKAENSGIQWFKDRKLPSVDNLDQIAGRAALIFALDGASGSFGVKSTADSLLPRTAGAS